MPGFTLVTTQVIIARNAGALYGLEVGNANMTSYVSQAGSNVDAFLNTVYANSVGTTSTASVAAALVANLGLTGTAATEGTNYIVAQLNAVAYTARGAVVNNILSAFANLTSDATYGAAATTWNTKVANAVAYAAVSGNADSTWASVGETAVGQTFTLTTSVDLMTGGTGDDVFYGSVIGDLATGTTLNPGDNLKGGDGTDRLEITISGDPTATTQILQTTGVETYNIGNYDSANGTDLTLGLSSVTGLKNINMTGGNGDTLFTGVAAVVGLSGSNSSGDIKVTYASGVLAGTEDTQAITLSNFGLSNDSPTITVADAGATAGTAETVTIASSGTANFATLSTDNNHKTVTVTGAAALTLDLNPETAITKLDASAATGALTAKNLGASKIALTGGAGNDVVIDTNGNFDADDTVTGGNGTDSLGLYAAITAANAKNITGFEKLVLGLNVTQAVNAFTGIATLVVDHTAVNGSANGSNKTSSFSSAAGTESLEIRTQSETDDVTVALATNGTADSIAVTLGTATAAVTVDVLDLDNYETITLTSQGNANTITDLTASSLKTLNIAGEKAITIDSNSTGTWTALKTVDASKATANVTLGALDAAGTITGGAGNDTFEGSSSADSVTGGAGNDTIKGGGGNDTLDGGDGNDSITAKDASQDVIKGGAGDDTITGATGNDNIDGGAGNDVFVINASDAGTPVLDISSADTIVGGDGTDTLRIEGKLTEDRTIDLSGTTETRLSGVSGVEKITLNTTEKVVNLKVGDIALGAFGSSLTVDVASDNALAHTLDASAVLNNSSKVNFTGNSADNTYTVGNGIDNVNLSTGNDTVTVGNILFLQSTDTIVGGAGADILKFTATGTTSITAAQLAGVSGMETLNITSGGSDAYTVNINDAIVTANKDAAADKFTIKRAAEAGTLKMDASAITTGKLAITGGSGADTITGGTLADELTGGSGDDSIVGGTGNDTITGGAGVDTLTGGAGVDTFKQSESDKANRDKITDFTAGTGGDVFNFKKSSEDLSGTNNFTSAAALESLSGTGGITIGAATEVAIITGGTITNNLYQSSTANDLKGTNLIAITGAITTQAAAKVLLAISDQFGNVGIYYGDSGSSNTDLAADEIALVGVLQSTTLSSLVYTNFANAA